MIWQEQRWAIFIGMSLYLIGVVSRVVGLFFVFEWKQLIYAAAFASLAHDCWRGLKRLREEDEATILDVPDSASDSDWNQPAENADSDDGPMISFVLLRCETKFLEEVVLQKILSSAWGGEFVGSGEPDDEDRDDASFVIGENPMFIVKAESGHYIIHNHDEPYWEDVDEVVEQIDELRLRKAVADHTAWLSVDLIVPDEQNESPDSQYGYILDLILELADEETLAIFRPDTAEINVWSDDLADRLSEPGAYEMFAEPENVPVIPIADDDPNMLEAVATAQQRWPEFVTAFENKQPRHDKFSVKAKITVGDSTEFIWMDVIGLEPKYVHGLLANDPVDLGELKLGSQVEVPLDDVCDWCYMVDEDPVGLFSLEAIRKAQAARRDEK